MRDSKLERPSKDIRYTDPFSAEAVRLAQKFITSVEQRLALENEIKQLSDMQRLLGYWGYGTTLGVVDGEPPISMLKRAYASKVDRD